MRAGVMALTALMVLAMDPAAAQQRGERGTRMQERASQERMQLRGTVMRGGMLATQAGRALDRRNELGLTDAQVTELAAILQEARTGMAPLRDELVGLRDAVQDGTMERAAAAEAARGVQERMRALDEPLRVRLGEVLPAGQRARLAPMGRAGQRGTMRSALGRDAPRRGRRPWRGGGGPPDLL